MTVQLTGLQIKATAGRLAEAAEHVGSLVRGQTSGRKRYAYETFNGHQYSAPGDFMRKTVLKDRANDR